MKKKLKHTNSNLRWYHGLVANGDVGVVVGIDTVRTIGGRGFGVCVETSDVLLVVTSLILKRKWYSQGTEKKRERRRMMEK